MKYIALIAALAVLSGPVLADGQRNAPQPNGNTNLDLTAEAPKPSAGRELERADTQLADRCNAAGGGMVSIDDGANGVYRCVRPDGSTINRY